MLACNLYYYSATHGAGTTSMLQVTAPVIFYTRVLTVHSQLYQSRLCDTAHQQIQQLQRSGLQEHKSTWQQGQHMLACKVILQLVAGAPSSNGTRLLYGTVPLGCRPRLA